MRFPPLALKGCMSLGASGECVPLPDSPSHCLSGWAASKRLADGQGASFVHCSKPSPHSKAGKLITSGTYRPIGRHEAELRNRQKAWNPGRKHCSWSKSGDGVSHPPKEKTPWSVRADSVALQPRTLISDSIPTPCSLGKSRLATLFWTEQGEQMQRCVSHFRPDKPRQSPRFQPKQAGRQSQPVCMAPGEQYHKTPFPGRKTCKVQGFPHSHLFSSCMGFYLDNKPGLPT